MTLKSILLVEDDKDLLESTEYLLKSKGYETHTANDGQTAIDIYKSIRPGLVFMDISMPIMNGIEAFYKIREFDSSAKVIFVSAHVNDDETIEAAKNNGLLLMETKPVSIKRLEELIEKFY